MHYPRNFSVLVLAFGALAACDKQNTAAAPPVASVLKASVASAPRHVVLLHMADSHAQLETISRGIQ